MKEWEILRNDIRSQIEQSKYLEYATVVAVSAFYAWFLTASRAVPKLILVLPVLAVLLGGIRAWGTLKHVQRMATYVRRLEEGLSENVSPLIGWDRTRVITNSKSPELKLSAVLFWLVALLVTTAAAWLL